MKIKIKIKIILSLILFSSTLHAANLQYSITPLGTLGGNQSVATDINDKGEIVGESFTNQNINHAFYSSIVNGKRVMTDLSPSQNSDISIAKAINNNGQIVGSFKVPGDVIPIGAGSYLTHAFIAEKNGNNWVVTDLNREEYVSSSAEDINDSAQIVGYLYATRDGETRPVQAKAGPFFTTKIGNNWSTTDLYPEVLGRESKGSSINNSGRMTVNKVLLRPTRTLGLSVVNNNGSWEVSNIGTLGGNHINIEGINNSNQITGFGQIAGTGKTHAFIASETGNEWTLTDLGQHNGLATISQDINDSGVVIGFTRDNSNLSAFINIDNQMHTLFDLVSSGKEGWSSLQKAKSINNLNQIVGVGKYNGKTMAFLLTPITENSNAAICKLGLDPQTIKKGEGTAIWWWSDAATSGNINNGIGSLNAITGYKWIFPTKTTTYTMTANGADGATTTCEATIIVEGQTNQQQNVCGMGADPQVIKPGQGSALWWWTNNAASASINNGVGSVKTPSDFVWFHPKTTTTYTMTVVDKSGKKSSCQTTIEVTSPQ